MTKLKAALAPSLQNRMLKPGATIMKFLVKNT
jgi:hypothetical protein